MRRDLVAALEHGIVSMSGRSDRPAFCTATMMPMRKVAVVMMMRGLHKVQLIKAGKLAKGTAKRGTCAEMTSPPCSPSRFETF